MRGSMIGILWTAIWVAGCSGESEALPANSGSPAKAGPPAATANAAVAQAPAPAPAAPAYTLADNGLLPGLAFGTPRDQAVAAARAAFGQPTGREHNDECGEGPMDFVSFGHLQLSFQEGRLVGWSVDDPRPDLRTAGGLHVGAPRSALGSTEVEEESSLGAEFAVGDIGGILDEQGARIQALWAGAVCQFR